MSKPGPEDSVMGWGDLRDLKGPQPGQFLSSGRNSKKSESVSCQLCLPLWDPMDCNPADSSVHRILQSKNTGVGKSFPSPGDLPNPGIELRSPAFRADSLLSEPPGKPSIQYCLLSELQENMALLLNWLPSTW